MKNKKNIISDSNVVIKKFFDYASSLSAKENNFFAVDYFMN